MAVYGIGIIVISFSGSDDHFELTLDCLKSMFTPPKIIYSLSILVCIITAVYFFRCFYVIVGPDGVLVRVGKKIDYMRWDAMQTVGYFLIRGQPIMFFSTIPGIWKIHGMFGNDLPLSVLIKVFPNKKIEALVKEYYKGEIVYLE